jgi:tetratricopeptide (TPR) repeat protein
MTARFPMRPCRPLLARGALIAGLAALSLAAVAPARAQASLCGDLWNAYGPYDYRSARDKLAIVERFHFTPQVEALVKGVSGSIAGDIGYTLRAFPNHHRALISIMRLGEKQKTPHPEGSRYSVDCYFERAVRFRPDDHVVRMIFAGHLGKTGREEAALQQLESATHLVGDNPMSHHNIGLVYLELKQYDRALAQAHKAMALGYERTDLKDQLKAAGRWVDP